MREGERGRERVRKRIKSGIQHIYLQVLVFQSFKIWSVYMYSDYSCSYKTL